MGFCNLLPRGQPLFDMSAVQTCDVQGAGEPGRFSAGDLYVSFKSFALRGHAAILAECSKPAQKSSQALELIERDVQLPENLEE
jgi:hypothetical protein